MNVGQILETHLGWAARALGVRFATPVFDGADGEGYQEELASAKEVSLDKRLYDGSGKVGSGTASAARFLNSR